MRFNLKLSIIIFLSFIFCFTISIYSITGTGDVSGKVIDAVTNKGLSKTKITFISGGNIFVTETFPDGLYMTTILPGGYIIKCEKPGYVSKTVTEFMVSEDHSYMLIFKLHPLPPTVSSVNPIRINAYPGKEKGMITINGAWMKRVNKVMIKASVSGKKQFLRIVESRDKTLKVDLFTGNSYTSGTDWRGYGTIDLFWPGGDKIHIPASKFKLNIIYPIRKIDRTTSVMPGISKRLPNKQNSLLKSANQNNTLLKKNTPTQILNPVKQDLKIKFKTPANRALILRSDKYFRIQWTYNRKLEQLTRNIRINIELLNARNKSKVGTIARNIPVNRMSLPWTAGKLGKKFVNPDTKYIIRIITTSGKVLDEMPVTILPKQIRK